MAKAGAAAGGVPRARAGIVQKKRTAMLVGDDIRAGFAKGYDNILVVGDGKRSLTEGDVNIGHCDHVITWAHGMERGRNTPNETHLQLDLFEKGLQHTIQSIGAIMQRNSPEHITILSCHGGAIGRDIESNLAEIANLMQHRKPPLKPLTHLTISAISSAKNETIAPYCAIYCEKLDSADDRQERWLKEIELARDMLPETIKQYHIVIDRGKPKFLAVKIRSPKDIKEIRNPAKFKGSYTLYGNKVVNKVKRTEAQLVVEKGDPKDLALKSIFTKMVATLSVGKKSFSHEYIQNALLVGVERNKPALIKEYIAQGANVEYKYAQGTTALHVAATSDKAAALEELIAAGAKVDILMDSGETPLPYVAGRGYTKIVEILAENGADPNASTDKRSASILLASQNGHKEVVQILIANRANINTAADSGATPLSIAAQNGHKEIVAMLLESKAEVDSQTNEGATALLKAAENGYTEIVRMLLASGANVNIAQAVGVTPLFVAAQNGHKEIVAMLLESKAEVGSQANDGATALLKAAEKGHTEIVGMLLARGANVDAISSQGVTALLFAAQNGHTEIVNLLLEAGAKPNVSVPALHGKAAVHIAVLKNHVGVIKALIAHNADLNIKFSEGFTPLHIAIELGNTEIAKLLINNGADLTAKANDGRTALQIRPTKNQAAIAKLIAEAKSAINMFIASEKGDMATLTKCLAANINPNIQNDKGVSALLLASQGGHIEMVDLLLSRKANPCAATKDGVKPLFVASSKGHINVINRLLASAVDINAAREDGVTPLHIALAYGHGEAAKELVKAGASLLAESNKGITPLDVNPSANIQETQGLLAQLKVERNKQLALIAAAEEGDLATTTQCLGEGVAVNAKMANGLNALYLAVQNGHTEVVKTLLKAKAKHDTVVLSMNDQSALHIATIKGHIEIFQALIADKADLNIKRDDGATPLHLAVALGNVEAAEVLLASGANWDAKTNAGFTPAQITPNTNKEAMAAFIAKAEAREQAKKAGDALKQQGLVAEPSAAGLATAAAGVGSARPVKPDQRRL